MSGGTHLAAWSRCVAGHTLSSAGTPATQSTTTTWSSSPARTLGPQVRKVLYLPWPAVRGCWAEAGLRAGLPGASPRRFEEPVSREIDGVLSPQVVVSGQAPGPCAYCPRAWLPEGPSASSRCFCSRLYPYGLGAPSRARVWTRCAHSTTPLCAVTQAHFFSPVLPPVQWGKNSFCFPPFRATARADGGMK